MRKILPIIGLISIMSCITVNQNENSLKINTTKGISQDKQAIESIFDQQEKAWNSHSIDQYMDAFWHSDQLKFYSTNGLNTGWENTLNLYKKAYASADKMGTLKFQIDDISPIQNYSYSAMGKYTLQKNNSTQSGTFMVVFKKINHQWKIISNTSF